MARWASFFPEITRDPASMKSKEAGLLLFSFLDKQKRKGVIKINFSINNFPYSIKFASHRINWYSFSYMKKAVILLSGGVDSTTTLYWARNEGYKTYALLFDYGQRHRKEIRHAIGIAKKSKTPYHCAKISLPWKGSTLLDSKSKLPSGRNFKEMVSGTIPNTYVPARNTIFLSFALSYADAIDADYIIIGVNAVDFSGYPDCRPDYIKAVQKVADLGTRQGSERRKIKILTPLIQMTKVEIVRLGTQLKVPYQLTWSCYQGGPKPCGKCDSCLIRKKGFEEAGVRDF